ncbi:SDR family NAD(P)-dependent oxidoreductase [Xylophilus sp. Kf1]|nr:SDR family NAD(P)-dependent oxidoreductase [Xylophilus sp. Kf1]
MPGAGERIAVFGATSAIAAALAGRHAARGARLYLVGRDAGKLAALVARLGGAVAGHARQDFDRTDQAEACVAAAVAALGGIDIAVVAHGLLGDQRASEQRFEEAEQIARTNYLGVQALLIPLANHLEQRRGGRLVVLSSVAADRGRPRNYTYAAAKAALDVYLQGLRSRLYRSGVTVHTIKLGPVDSPMTADHPKNALFSQVPEVARRIERAVDRRVPVAYVPGYWRLVMLVVRHLPEAVFQRIGGLSGR